MTFAKFVGTAGGSAIPEWAPQGSLYVDVGGDMGFFDSAGKDPIFYAHHSNADKIWSDWNKASSSHTNSTDPAFLSLTWTFFGQRNAYGSKRLRNSRQVLRFW